MRRAIVRAAAGAPLAALVGCSPEHDWREIRPADAGCSVMLPAKPATLTRRINLEGTALDMTMHGAQARGVSYTVGTIVLPAADEAMLARALASMRAAMVRNIGGTERASAPVPIARVDPAGLPSGSVPGVQVEATGRMRDRDAVLLARFVGLGAQAWQAVVLGEAPDREQAATFLESLKLLR